jgi:hypothetical protein
MYISNIIARNIILYRIAAYNVGGSVLNSHQHQTPPVDSSRHAVESQIHEDNAPVGSSSSSGNSDSSSDIIDVADVGTPLTATSTTLTAARVTVETYTNGDNKPNDNNNSSSSSSCSFISKDSKPIKSVKISPLSPPVHSKPKIPTSDDDVDLHSQFLSMVDHVSVSKCIGVIIL